MRIPRLSRTGCKRAISKENSHPRLCTCLTCTAILSRRKYSPLHHNKNQPGIRCPTDPSTTRGNRAGSELSRATANPASTQYQSRSRWLHRYHDITQHHFPPPCCCLWRGQYQQLLSLLPSCPEGKQRPLTFSNTSPQPLHSLRAQVCKCYPMP